MAAAGAEARREFERMLEPHLDPLFATALRLTRNRADAEDLIQEAVLNAWRSLASFERGTNFKAWMFRILTNAFISRKRSEARGGKVSDLVDVADIAEVARDESFEPGEWERVYPLLVDDDMKNALDELPDEFRAPLLLSSLGGLAYKEIAAALGVPIGTVMSRLFRARARMRKSLQGYAKKRVDVAIEDGSGHGKPSAGGSESAA